MEYVKEGSLYKSIKIEDCTFNIYYGYFSDAERTLWEPSPIFPDFAENPMFTKGGKPFTRADQDVCEHYKPKINVSGENWCNDCSYFKFCEELLGVCNCEKKKSTLRKNE